VTARPSVRRRSTLIAAGLTVAMLLVAGVLALIGANSVVNSTAGDSVDPDDRPILEFPPTDNAALAVVDEQGRLASLVVATLLPSGTGGSIVNIPVNADANVGLDTTVRPLEALLDPDNPAAFFESVENTLALSLQFGEIAGAERLEALLAPVAPVSVDLAGPVLDGSSDDTDVVVDAGVRQLDASMTALALAAIDTSGASYDHHWIDVDLWSAIAGGAGDVETQVDERPVTTLDDLFTRLWAGPVQARDLELQPDVGPFDLDAVVLSRRDVFVVFGQISPVRVAAPGAGLVFRIVVPFSDEQISATDGLFDSRTDVARAVVGEMLSFENNVVSVDITPADGGAPELTKIEVASEGFVPDLQASAFLIYGEAEAVLATERIDGVDAVITLGTSYFDLDADAGGANESTAETDVGDTVVDDG